MTKAKAKEVPVAPSAPQGELLERVVIGPKSLWVTDPTTGSRREAKIGDTVFLPPHQAKSKARYLQAPAVAKAQAEAKAAEEAEAEKEAPETQIAIEATAGTTESGGDSPES